MSPSRARPPRPTKLQRAIIAALEAYGATCGHRYVDGDDGLMDLQVTFDGEVYWLTVDPGDHTYVPVICSVGQALKRIDAEFVI